MTGSVLLTCILLVTSTWLGYLTLTYIWPWPLWLYTWNRVVYIEHFHLHAVFLLIIFLVYLFLFYWRVYIPHHSFLFQIVYSMVHVSSPKLYIPLFKYFCTFTKLTSFWAWNYCSMYIYIFTIKQFSFKSLYIQTHIYI